MAIEFYDVRKRAKVGVPEDQIKKTSFERTTKAGKTQIRYAINRTGARFDPDWPALSYTWGP